MNNRRFASSNVFKVNHINDVAKALRIVGIKTQIVPTNTGAGIKVTDIDNGYLTGFDDVEIIMLGWGRFLTAYATSVQTPQEALEEVFFGDKDCTTNMSTAVQTIIENGKMVYTDLYSFLQNELLPDEEIKLVIVDDRGENTPEVQVLSLNNIEYDWSIN